MFLIILESESHTWWWCSDQKHTNPLPGVWLPVLGASSPTLFQLLTALFEKPQPALKTALQEQASRSFSSHPSPCFSQVLPLSLPELWQSHAAVKSILAKYSTLTLTHRLYFLPWPWTCLITIYSSGNLDYWLNLVSIPKPALLTLLRYGETVTFQWGHCLCLPCPSWTQFYFLFQHYLPSSGAWHVDCYCKTEEMWWKL